MIAYNIYRKIRTLISTFIVCSISDKKFSSIKIASFTTYAPKGKTSIGKDFYAGEDFYLSTNKYCRLVIGDGVMFGPCVRVLGGNHSYTYTASHLRYHQKDDPNTKAIELEDGVWIGANVTILSGARISEGSIVGASSLVCNYIPPYVIATGFPAKKFRPRFDSIQLKEILVNVKSRYSYQEILKIYDKYNVQLEVKC